MATNKDKQTSGTQGSKGTGKDREFESQGQKMPNRNYGEGGHDQQAGGTRQPMDTPGAMEDDDMTTAGGREGQFSDQDRGKEAQWSPGSKQASDQ